MKRFSILLLALILIMNSTFAYGNASDKLSNHWSKDFIDRSFLAHYFPYLAKDNFSRLNPNEGISRQDFSLSTASLFKEYGFEISGVDSTGNMTRKDMISSLGEKLISIGLKNDKSEVLPFRDINTMDGNSIELLRLLYSNGIIEGDSNSIFAPDRHLSQAEAVIILQRVKGVLENMKDIPFKILGVVQSFNNQEEMITTQEGDKVLLTITKEFPTPGYDISISKITREKNGKKIQFHVKPPAPDSIQLQVVTYKTITVAIDKKDIGQPPYNFILDGYNKILNKDIQ